MGLIGIRREDKSRHERRAPIDPATLAAAIEQHGIGFVVEPSEIRVFPDAEYSEAGGRVDPDLSSADLIMGVKEIPVGKLIPGMAYLYFSHVIKGQDYNMAMLRRLLELNCTLLDYERIADDQGRRQVFFGYHAGLAGMIDTLWVLGEKLRQRGIGNPLEQVKQALEYRDLAAACQAVAEAGAQIKAEGLPAGISPLVVGFAGYGNVSRGAQYVFDHLPHRTVSPEELPEILAAGETSNRELVKVVFKEEHMAGRKDGGQFELQEYFDSPELYTGIFEGHLPYLSVLVNCIYWDTMYPRLVTRKATRALAREQRLRLIAVGDITCDIDGSVEMTTKATGQDEPVLMYDPDTDRVTQTLAGPGVAVVAVDNLPAELPRDSTLHFGQSLAPFLPALADMDRTKSFAELELAPELKKAVIVWNGKLTDDYQYLEKFL